MLELYIIRHGLAGTPLEDEALDEERPLKKKGKDQMKGIAHALKDLDISFDVVITSPLLRAVESAEILNDSCGVSKKAIVSNFLVPGAPFNNLVKFLNTFKDAERVAIVGHEPMLSAFASFCLTNDKNSFLHLKKGGVIMLECEGALKPGKCLLAWLMEPKHLIHKKSK